MDEKEAHHVEVGDTQHISSITSTGLAKKQEHDIKARNADFAAAVSENRPSAWGKGYLLLYGYCLILYLCSTMNGYGKPPPAQPTRPSDVP